jgi:hypothetical protein
VASLISRIEANQAKTDVNLNKIRSIVNVWIVDMKDGRKEMTACQGKAEAHLECMEPTSVDMEPEVEHQEVPKEEATVILVGELRKQRRDWNLAAERHPKPKERTRGYCGSWKGVIIASRSMAHCARAAWHKTGVVRKDWTRSKVERTTRRAGLLRERGRTCHEGRKGVKDLGG